MSTSDIFITINLAAILLPGIVAIRAYWRSLKEGGWQNKLWKDHEKETDLEKRKQLRSEMRDLDGLCSESTQVSLRGSVLAVLLGIQSAILWALTEKGSTADPERFWVLVASAAFAWLLVAMTLMRSFKED